MPRGFMGNPIGEHNPAHSSPRFGFGRDSSDLNIDDKLYSFYFVMIYYFKNINFSHAIFIKFFLFFKTKKNFFN